MGSKKKVEQWSADVSKEFLHMRTTNPKMVAIFGGVTDEDICNQIESCLKNQEVILSCVPEDERTVLTSRFDWLKQYLHLKSGKPKEKKKSGSEEATESK